MASGNYRKYLKGDMVRAKKYFYVIRPILACRWILKYNCPPPILFSELCESVLCEELKPAITELLNIKINLPEIGEIPKIQILYDYIEKSLIELQAKIDSLEEEDIKGYDELNNLFLEAIEL